MAVSWREMPPCVCASKVIRTSAVRASTTSASPSGGHRPCAAHWRCRACRKRRSPRSVMARSVPRRPAATRTPGRRTAGSKSCTSIEEQARMKAVVPAAFAMLLLAGCVTTPEVDPMQVRLDDLDARVGRIDRVVSNNSLVQMAQQIEAQQQELRQLRGRIDELQNENTKLRQEQRNLYTDLD